MRYCERCEQLWLLSHEQYMDNRDAHPLDDAYLPALQPDGRLDDVLALMTLRAGPGRRLVTGYFGKASYDVVKAVRVLAHAVDEKGLTEQQVQNLLADLRAAHGNRRLGSEPKWTPGQRRALTMALGPNVDLRPRRGPRKTAAACEGCEAASRQVGDGAPMPPPWKPLNQHPRLRSFLPWSHRGDGMAFCEQCERLWLVRCDQYASLYFAQALDPAYTAIFEPQPAFTQVWPLLPRTDAGRALVTQFLRQARSLDGNAAARETVRAMRARDLTSTGARHLLDDLQAVLENPRVSARPRPAVRLDDAEPILALLTRNDLYDDVSNAAVARVDLRDRVDRLVRGMFASAFDPAAQDLVAVPGRARDQLLRLTGTEARRRQARARVDRVDPNADDLLARFDANLAELRRLLWETAYRPTPKDLRAIIDTLRRLDHLAPADTLAERRSAWLAAEYRQMMQALHDEGRVPAECAREVSALLGGPGATSTG